MKKILLLILAIGLVINASSQTNYNIGIIAEQLLKTDSTAIGQKLVYPDFKDDEITILKVTVPPGESTGWHKHLFPVFAFVLEGNLTVELENSKTILLTKNSSFSEVLNTFHNGVNKDKENAVLIVFYMGEKGKPLSVRKDQSPEQK